MTPLEMTPGRLKSIRLADVEPRATTWLWPGYIPAGALTLIDGDPGCGKSTIAASFVASVSAGKPWPDRAPCSPGSVLIFSAEEEIAETIRPKIDAAGGDPNRIHIVEGVLDELGSTADADKTRWFSLARDTEALEQTIRQHDARLVIFDVLASYMGGTDTHRDADTRSVLGPLAKVAGSTGVAMIGLRHLNKAAGTNALYRGGGSIAFNGQARAVFLTIQPDPDDEKHIFACVKLNVARKPKARGYTLESFPFTDHASTRGEVARVAWGSEETYSANQALAAAADDPDQRSAVDDAMDYTRETLADGPIKTEEFTAAAIKEGHSKRTLERARKLLGVTSKPDGLGGPWMLALPVSATEPQCPPTNLVGGHWKNVADTGGTPRNGSTGPNTPEGLVERVDATGDYDAPRPFRELGGALHEGIGWES